MLIKEIFCFKIAFFYFQLGVCMCVCEGWLCAHMLICQENPEEGVEVPEVGVVVSYELHDILGIQLQSSGRVVCTLSL